MREDVLIARFVFSNRTLSLLSEKANNCGLSVIPAVRRSLCLKRAGCLSWRKHANEFLLISGRGLLTFRESPMMPRYLLVLFATLLPFSVIDAGEYNPVLNIGDVVQPWEKLPGIDDKTHSWSDFKDKKVLVVVFTCNSCPYAVDYEARIQKLADKWQRDDRFALIAVNSNLIDEDSLEAMKEHAQAQNFTYPYLKDEKQELGKAWGATRTPEFFVIDGQRKVVYMGAMDNDTNADDATVNYVDLAVSATLAGNPPEVQETVAIGCNIRYRRSRR